MCGITGFIDFTNKSTRENLVAMTDCLHHRGPDDSGCEIISHANASIGFGFRRLSIIDLSPLGHQPMTNENTGDVIMLNGEIYNYSEIRKELEHLNYKFISNSDTEVILKAYRQWGKKCVDKFIGMFAIALYDKRKEKIIFIRDRAGVKPFYWYWKDNVLLFASELKAFHQHPSFKKEIDFDALALFFQHAYIASPHCIFKNTQKLLPGHFLEVDLKTKNITTEKYWNVIDAYNQPKLNISFDNAVNETEKILERAFQYRMVADVPVGVFLSGGYDSSCVTALLQKNSSKKIKTFTIGFHEDAYNEAHHAKKVAEHLGTDHHEYYCTFKEAMEIVPRLADIYDEPFGDSSAIPTTLVSKIAREHVTVALSADGSDEVFAGYPRTQHGVNLFKKLSMIPEFLSPLMKIFESDKRNLADADRMNKLRTSIQKNDLLRVFEIINQTYTSDEIKRFLKAETKSVYTPFSDNQFFSKENDSINRIIATEYHTYLSDDILHKVDRATMSVSLEGREPFLDQHIIEFVARLPSSYKLKNGEGKILLKEIVHRYIPKKIMDRPKMGFGIPVSDWCKKELRDLFLHYMDKDEIKKQGIFDAEKISALTNRYLNNKLENFERIWLVFVFQMWYERWMK